MPIATRDGHSTTHQPDHCGGLGLTTRSITDVLSNENCSRLSQRRGRESNWRWSEHDPSVQVSLWEQALLPQVNHPWVKAKAPVAVDSIGSGAVAGHAGYGSAADGHG